MVGNIAFRVHPGTVLTNENSADRAWAGPKWLPLAGALCLFTLLPAWGVLGADNEGEWGSLTLQNDRIAVFGSSWAAGCYGSSLASIVGREVESFILADTGVVGALQDCGAFNKTRFGIILTSFGGNDFWPQGRPWEDVEGDFRQLLRCLKSSGAVVVYNQLIPESYGYNTGQVCREEGVLLVPGIAEGIGLPMNLSPHFYDGDPVHPSGEGYSVMAERTARVLLGSGLVQTARTCEDLSGTTALVFSRARDLIDGVDAIGGYTEAARDHFTTAEYLRANGFCYTANWSLHSRIIDPLESFLARWGEIEDLGTYFAGLFESANSSIQELEGKGMNREVMLMKADYSRAEKAWTEHEYDAAELYLEKVIAKFQEIPEPLVCVIPSLVILLAFRWKMWTRPCRCRHD